MKTVSIVALFLAASLLSAQGMAPGAPGPAAFPAALRLFLDLSDQQVIAIQNLNLEFSRFVNTKERRVQQVRFEIAQETAKQPLDPMALGLRYAEIETIRRQVEEEETRLRARIQQLLNDAQRARLKALEDALKLQPIYGEAVAVRLLTPPPVRPVPMPQPVQRNLASPEEQ